MQNYTIRIYTKSEELPVLTSRSFFHSPELFRMIEQTPGLTPYMAVATDTTERVHGHLLAMVRRRGSWVPPYIFSQGRIYGEGCYAEDADKDEIFAHLLSAITDHLRQRLCLYIEVSDVSRKMFGYRHFRENAFFPVPWMQIHNSHHSHPPEDRIEERSMIRVNKAYATGVDTHTARDEQEVRKFYQLLRRYYRFRYQRFIPHYAFFRQLAASKQGRVEITTYRSKVVGGNVIVQSGDDAYLWFTVSKKKSHPLLHPDYPTVWHALKSTSDEGRQHLFFMNVGLPYSRNPMREFLLSFGGKPVSTYRWFRFTPKWLNKLLAWFYRE